MSVCGNDSGDAGGETTAAPMSAEEASVRAAVQLTIIALTPALSLFGVAANAVNIAVLTRKWMKSSTNYYLTALAVTDIAYLCLFYLITVKFYPGVSRLAWFAHLLAGMFPLANLLSNFATWLTCFFTFERWVVVHNPMLGRRYCTRGRAKQTIAGIFVAALLFTLPNFFEYRVTRREVNGTVEYSLGKTGAYEQLLKAGYYHITPTVFIFGPLLFLVVFNSLLICSVLRAKKRQARLSAVATLPMSPPTTAMLEQQRRRRQSSAATMTTSTESVVTRRTCSNSSSGRRIRYSQPQLQVPSAVAAAAAATANRRYRPGGSGGSEQQKVTVMLIAVVIVFCLCQLPSAALTLLKTVAQRRDAKKCVGNDVDSESDATPKPALTAASVFDLVAPAVVNLLLVVNAACNFVLYSCFSTKFRNTFRQLFLGRCAAPDQQRAGLRQVGVGGRCRPLAGAGRPSGAESGVKEDSRPSLAEEDEEEPEDDEAGKETAAPAGEEAGSFSPVRRRASH